MKGIVIEREILFAQVWSKPMVRLASEYGISDVGLAKICRKMEIPRPPRGYWAKAIAGKLLPPKPKLKALSQKGVQQVVINLTPILMSAGNTNSKPVVKINVPEVLAEPHRLIKATRAALIKGKPNERGLISPGKKNCLDMNVTKGTIERACLIMDALLKTIELEGFEVIQTQKSPYKTTVIINGESIEIGIDEKVSQTDHLLTDDEKRRRKRGEWVYPPKYDYHPTGNLVMRIRNAYSLGVRQQWADGKIQRVEDCLGEFFLGLKNVAAAKIAVEEEFQRRQRERKEEQIRRAELQRLTDIEIFKARKLTTDMANWENADRMRRYLVALHKINVSVPGLEDWITWCAKYIESIDPLLNPDLDFPGFTRHFAASGNTHFQIVQVTHHYYDCAA